MEPHRRSFLRAASLGAAPLLIPAASARADDKKKGEPEEEISAPEDLMREHGVLNRILLIYEEGLRRLKANQEVPPDAFLKPANLVRKFVEAYHEKLEETFIFPEFEKRKKLTDLVRVLRQQHAAGRRLTDVILRAAAPNRFGKGDARGELTHACEEFVRMYRPHEAREDTVLFPALYKAIPAKQVRELGEQFEKEEHRLFGEEGFEKTVAEVAAVEKQLGIYDLAAFTPK
jgi:hemerythrin-like domain-containing protein